MRFYKKLLADCFALMLCCPVAAFAFEVNPQHVFKDGSEWTINVNGVSTHLIMYGQGGGTGSKGELTRRLVTETGHPGQFRIAWNSNSSTVEIALRGQRHPNCKGRPARDLSFITGSCFKTVFLFQQAKAKPDQHRKLQRDLNACRQNERTLQTKISTCASNLGSSKTLAKSSERQIDRRYISAMAAMPQVKSKGTTDSRTDAAIALEAPVNPARGTIGDVWIRRLMNEQRTALIALYGDRGHKYIVDRSVQDCRGKRFCRIELHQRMIVSGIKEIGQ